MSADQRLRADARRNRARVLEVAAHVFASEGLSVPVHEIARRAGVGTGTVSRHFPTKESLFEAILSERVDELVALADRLAAQDDPQTAFLTFFGATVRAGAEDRGLAERLSSAAGTQDPHESCVGAAVLCERLGTLLDSAQRAGAVRGDITLADVEALMVACMAQEASLQTMIAVVEAGLRTADAPLP